MRPQTAVCFGLFVLGVVALLIQMWFRIWSEELFLKIIISDVLLFAVAFVAYFLLKEEKDARKIDGEHNLR